MNYWLIKSEPGCYSIDDLKRDGSVAWEGVRNYQARNFMRDGMKLGDLALFHHSGAEPPGVVGIAEVSAEAHPDMSAFDPSDEHFDPKSNPEKPAWMCVDFKYVSHFKRLVPIRELREDPALAGLLVTRPGQRLSVMPVEEAHFKRIMELGND